MNIQQKRIPVAMILTCIFAIIICILLRNKFMQDGYTYIDDIEFFSIILPFKGTVALLIILLGISLYLFIYTTDTLIRNRIRRLKARGMTLFSNKERWYLIKVFATILIIVALLTIATFYFYSLQSQSQPLSWFESLFVGFFKVFFTLSAITLAWNFLKFLLKNNNKS